MTFSDLALLSIATQKRYNWPMFLIATFAFHARICMLCMFIHMHMHSGLVSSCCVSLSMTLILGTCILQEFRVHFSPAVELALFHGKSGKWWPPASVQDLHLLQIFDTQQSSSRNINIYPWIPAIMANFPVHFHLILHIILLGLIEL